nr:MAG TPA: hypothetical protein [Caudoviricetes sp.]
MPHHATINQKCYQVGVSLCKLHSRTLIRISAHLIWKLIQAFLNRALITR